MRKSFWIIPVLSLFVATGAPTSHADTINFRISGGDTGNITITELAGAISAVSGTFDGATINTLIAVGGFGGNDNLFTSTSPYFDGSGLSFSLVTADSHGFDLINLSTATSPPLISFGTCQGNDPTTACIGPTSTTGGGFGPDSITITPEPSAFLLLGTGLLGLTVLRFRRKKLA